MAGGGTLLTFPSLIAYGVPSITANATSTVALVPGSFGAFWGYRKEGHAPLAEDLKFLVVSAIGGLLGALALLRVGDAVFSKLVPWLILSATALFILQEPLRKWNERRSKNVDAAEMDPNQGFSKRILVGQFFIGLYGGFFGAGSGILMLAALGFFGMRNMHQMNRLKNLANVAFNTVASITFIIGRHVDWKLAAIMMVGAIVGGYGGAGIAKKIGQQNVKRLVIVVGITMGVYTLAKIYA